MVIKGIEYSLVSTILPMLKRASISACKHEKRTYLHSFEPWEGELSGSQEIWLLRHIDLNGFEVFCKLSVVSLVSEIIHFKVKVFLESLKRNQHFFQSLAVLFRLKLKLL
jgi:hypothetical protein